MSSTPNNKPNPIELLENDEGRAYAWGGGSLVAIVLVVILLIILL